jgi:hypothetical protein
VVANGPGGGAIATEVQAHLFGSPAPRTAGPGSAEDLQPADCEGRYERRHVLQEVASEGQGLVATTIFTGPLAKLFPQPSAVRLDELGGGRFVSQREHEDAPTLWDFSDALDGGAPSLLLTNRLHRRTS